MPTDYYASRSFDDAMEPFCTAPDELPTDKLTSVMPGILPGDGAPMAVRTTRDVATAATQQPRRVVTIVYEIADAAAWRHGGNPLDYQHHGLKSVGVSMSDLMDRRDRLRAALEEIAESHDSPDNDSTARAALDADDQAT